MVDGLHANVMIVVGCPCSLSDIDNLNFVCFAWLNDFMIAHMVLLLSLEIWNLKKEEERKERWYFLIAIEQN